MFLYISETESKTIQIHPIKLRVIEATGVSPSSSMKLMGVQNQGLPRIFMSVSQWKRGALHKLNLSRDCIHVGTTYSTAHSKNYRYVLQTLYFKTYFYLS